MIELLKFPPGAFYIAKQGRSDMQGQTLKAFEDHDPLFAEVVQLGPVPERFAIYPRVPGGGKRKKKGGLEEMR